MVVVRPVLIVKAVVLASVFIAAGGAAIVLGVAQKERLSAVAGIEKTKIPQPPPGVRSDAQAASSEAQPTRAVTRTATALAASEAAAVAAELAGPPEAENQSAPSFDIARVDAGGDAVIAGRAAPGATVDLLRGGRRLDQAVADASGQFVIVSPRLPAGNYELTLSARLPDGTVTSSKQGVSVTVNDVGPSTREAQPRADDDSKTASQPSSKPPRVTGEPPKRTAGLEAAPAIDAAPAADESSSSPSDAHAISSKVVSRGDSLWRISRVTYGDGARYALVYRANRDRVRNPNLIYPGQTLVIPVKRN